MKYNFIVSRLDQDLFDPDGELDESTLTESMSSPMTYQLEDSAMTEYHGLEPSAALQVLCDWIGEDAIHLVNPDPYLNTGTWYLTNLEPEYPSGQWRATFAKIEVDDEEAFPIAVPYHEQYAWRYAKPSYMRS